MPIYEFKCINCCEYTELLMMNIEENIEIKCSKCGSKNLERIISTTNCSMSKGVDVSNNNSSASTQTRSCSGGSCTTYNIPGPV